MVTDRVYEEDGPSQYVVMREGVPRLGVATETLRRLCMKAQVDAGIRPGVTNVESQELPRLKREDAELRRANEIFKTAPVFLADHCIATSVGSRGDSYDNALAETVNGLCKARLIHARPAWPSVTEVEFETMEWVHWWNTTRIHQGLNYKTPNEHGNTYYETREGTLAHA